MAELADELAVAEVKRYVSVVRAGQTRLLRELRTDIDDLQDTVYAQAVASPVGGTPGYQDLIRAADPAAGESYRYRVGGEATLWPLSVMCRLTCSGVAGDRSLTVEYQDAEDFRYCVAGANVTLAASQVQAFCWQPLAGNAVWPVNDVALAPLPQQMLFPQSSLVIRLVGGDAADQIDQVRVSCERFPT